MSFAERIPSYQARLESALEERLRSAYEPAPRLLEAMRYSVLGGGKRIRPLLVYATGEILGVDPTRLDGPACAVECIHAYSLVHDDLPAMDDDDLRRGRPTCHRAFDEATAILAGDALQILAVEILATDPGIGGSPADRLAMVARLTAAAGARGMAGGQAMDLAAEGRRLSVAELETMHRLKTGALIAASVRLGAACAGPLEEPEHDALEAFGEAMGLAFQIQDDILDVAGEAETLGKRTGADAARGKPTYPSVAGMDAAKARAAELRDEAVAALEPLGEAAAPLRHLAEYIVGRRS